ncbi:MAG: 1-acyl-sn-glycerol-3-phosphate acyltransferase [Pseudomonadota bacterium]|nr:MAG: 1-acyl-sn-glycerol-3-phosphate acyltransferase [Pseudomonadota bacterium]
MIASTVLASMMIVVFALLPFHTRYSLSRTYARFNLWALRVLCGIHYQVQGAENIPGGPAIVLSKHQSTWETLALQVLFPPQVYVLKRELLRVPFFGWGLALLKPISINRGAGRKAVEQVVDQGTARLRDGLWVIVFPEGTRIPAGQQGRYKLGGAVLAAASGYPVVPVAHNSGLFWPRRQFLKRPGTIQVVIGSPIESTGREAADILKEAETWIEGHAQPLARGRAGNG